MFINKFFVRCRRTYVLNKVLDIAALANIEEKKDV